MKSQQGTAQHSTKQAQLTALHSTKHITQKCGVECRAGEQGTLLRNIAEDNTAQKYTYLNFSFMGYFIPSSLTIATTTSSLSEDRPNVSSFLEKSFLDAKAKVITLFLNSVATFRIRLRQYRVPSGGKIAS